MADMTDEIGATIEHDGFTILRNAVPRDTALALGKHSDQMWQARTNSEQHFLHEFDFLNKEPRFRALVSVRSVLQTVAALIGYNVYVYHCHLTVTGHCIDAEGRHLVPPYEWHQDSGNVIADLGGPVAPRISIKAGFLLGDVPSSDYGPTVMIPGSHRSSFAPQADRSALWANATPILGNAGDCVIFDNRVWHSRSPNRTAQLRRLASVAYAPRWLASRDRLMAPMADDCDDLHRQLLGVAQPVERHMPTIKELPLFKWLTKPLLQ